jgi:copper chaperone NosL
MQTMKQSRVLLVLGVMLLGLASVLPLWRIELEAPQYPEPIGLYIHINTLRGIGEHDLENINILNHYIGMKPIEPESIPELRIMPWILAALIGLGGLAIAVPRRWLIVVWIVAIAFAGTLGLYDFDQWEREYGSNLNPNAPIKIEGMTYKPPLIGTKQLLNITAHSYPSWGGWSILGALACGIGAWWQAGRISRKPVPIKTEHQRSAARHVTLLSVLGMLGVTQLACTPSPEPIRYGTDECSYCKMTIADRRFGAEIVSTKGKAYKFDSIECMVTMLRSLDSSDVALILATDFRMPGTFLDARSAWYVRSTKLPSPMGADLSAYADRASAEAAQRTHGGDILSWQDVQRYVATLD